MSPNLDHSLLVLQLSDNRHRQIAPNCPRLPQIAADCRSVLQRAVQVENGRTCQGG